MKGKGGQWPPFFGQILTLFTLVDLQF